MPSYQKEILSVHVGQAGIGVGKAFWDQVGYEHSLDDINSKPDDSKKDIEKLYSLYEFGSKGRLIPRCAMIDPDPDSFDLAGITKERFPMAFSGRQDSAATFARGKYPVDEVLDRAVVKIHRMFERMDNPEGIILYHGLAGGTGSGLGPRFTQRLDLDKGKTKMSIGIFPSLDGTSDSVLAPYNTLLSLQDMMDLYDLTLMFTNSSLSDICKRKLGEADPELKDLNSICALGVSAITGSIRYGGVMNKYLREFPQTFVVQPYLKYITVSVAPLMAKGSTHKASSTSGMMTQCLDPANQMMTFNPKDGDFMTCSFLSRGKVSESSLNKSVSNFKRSKVTFAHKSDSQDIKVSILPQPIILKEDAPLQQLDSSMCMVANHTGIRRYFETLLDKVEAMYKMKAYLHWYVAEGVDIGDFPEAIDSLKRIISDYKDMRGPNN